MAKIKKVVWRKEFGTEYPFCPYCNEFAYEKDHCVFCGKEYEWVEGSGGEPTIIEHNGYTIVQCTNNHIQIYKDGRIVMHASCTKKMTEEELRGQVAFLEMIRKESQ